MTTPQKVALARVFSRYREEAILIAQEQREVAKLMHEVSSAAHSQPSDS